MKRILTVLGLAALVALPHAHHAQNSIERIFLDTPSPDRAGEWLSALTQEPHVAGTAAQYKVVEFVRDRFKEFGLETELVKYDVFLNYPKNVSLRMVQPRKENLALIEE